MENQTGTKASEVYNAMYTAVGNSRRRSILTTLLDRASVLSEQELALALAATEQERSVRDISNEEAREIRTDLRHVNLPLLEDSGLVTWERAEETVTTTNHAALDDPRFQRLLETETEGIDDVLYGLANTRRRLLLATVRDEQTVMSLPALAQEVMRREGNGTEATRASINELVVALSHIHLPTLDDADIIEYDAEMGRVAYTGHPGLEEFVAILHESDDRFASMVDEFLGGLLTSYRQASKPTEDPFDWPTPWRDSYHG